MSKVRLSVWRFLLFFPASTLSSKKKGVRPKSSTAKRWAKYESAYKVDAFRENGVHKQRAEGNPQKKRQKRDSDKTFYAVTFRPFGQLKSFKDIGGCFGLETSGGREDCSNEFLRRPAGPFRHRAVYEKEMMLYYCKT